MSRHKRSLIDRAFDTRSKRHGRRETFNGLANLRMGDMSDRWFGSLTHRSGRRRRSVFGGYFRDFLDYLEPTRPLRPRLGDIDLAEEERDDLAYVAFAEPENQPRPRRDRPKPSPVQASPTSSPNQAAGAEQGSHGKWLTFLLSIFGL